MSGFYLGTRPVATFGSFTGDDSGALWHLWLFSQESGPFLHGDGPELSLGGRNPQEKGSTSLLF